MKNIFILKNKTPKEIFILIVISLHIFFWDIKFISNYGFRESIAFLLLFLFYDFINKEYYKSKDIIKRLLIIFFFLSIFLIHIYLNILFDNGIFFKENILALIGLTILSVVVYFYYNLIVEHIDFIISFFLIIFFLCFFISEYKLLTEWERKYSGICYGTIKIKHTIFGENSHLGMILGGVIGYILYSCKEKSLKFLAIIHLTLLAILILFPSITIFFSIFLSYLLILIYDYKFFFKKLLIFTLIILSFLSIFRLYVNCGEKIKETYTALNILDNNIFQNENKTENNQKLEKLNIENFGKKQLFIDERVPKDKRYLGETKQFTKRFNLTTAVFVNALNISLETLKSRFWGWGINRYQSAFDYYMFNGIVVPYFYHEVYTLNYNDGSANLPKLITEF